MEQPSTTVEVLFVATSSGLARALLDEHIDDGRGRCVTCPSVVHGRPAWPCVIVLIARTAEQLVDDYHRGEVEWPDESWPTRPAAVEQSS